MKKNPGRKERRNIARANRKAEGKRKMRLNENKGKYKRKDLSLVLRQEMIRFEKTL